MATDNTTLKRETAGHYSARTADGDGQWVVNAYRPNGYTKQYGWVVYRLRADDVVTDYCIQRTLAEAKRFISTFSA